MRSSPKRGRATTASPQKSSPGRDRGSYVDETVSNLQSEIQQLQFTIGQRDVEIERMKTTLFALNRKLSGLEDIQKDIDDHKSFIKTSESERGQLQTHIVTVSQTIRKDTEAHDVKHQKSLREIEVLRNEIQDLKRSMYQRESEHLKTVEQINQDHHQELAEKDEYQKRIEQEFNDLTLEQEQTHLDKIKELQAQFASTLEQRDREHQDELRQLDRDKTQREHDYIRKTSEMQKQHQQEIQKLLQDAASKLQRTIDDHAAELNMFRQQEKQKDEQHRDKIDQMRREAKQMLEDMQAKHEEENRDREDRHAQEIRDRIRAQEETERQLNDERENLRREKDKVIADLYAQIEQMRVKFETQINSLTITIETLEKQILVLKSTIIALEQDLERRKDVGRQLEEALNREQQSQDGRENLQKELENATDYILELEEKVYKANKTSLELLKQLKDAEIEMETLKQYIVDLKQRIAVYIPVKEDHVDRKLAEFINNYPERSKLKIMFMRESEGVYQFGTKRVAVKVEKDNIKIRVGGGYLSIDEFLDQYTPAELEKLERKDPLKRFSEKIAVQKTIVNAAVRESSPVRSDSPDRASHSYSPYRSNQRSTRR